MFCHHFFHYLTRIIFLIIDIQSGTLEKLYGAQLIWRIENVKQKQNEARSGSRTTIFSEPFMTSRHGYKMIASLSLYGDGPSNLLHLFSFFSVIGFNMSCSMFFIWTPFSVRGQYVSAFVGIMRGEYDALLKWPFTNRIIISLLDQVNYIIFICRCMNSNADWWKESAFILMQVEL